MGRFPIVVRCLPCQNPFSPSCCACLLSLAAEKLSHLPGSACSMKLHSLQVCKRSANRGVKSQLYCSNSLRH